MEIRIIKRDQVVNAEVSSPTAKQEPEKSFAQVIDKLIRDVRKKKDDERRMNVKILFRSQLRTSRLS